MRTILYLTNTTPEGGRRIDIEPSVEAITFLEGMRETFEAQRLAYIDESRANLNPTGKMNIAVARLRLDKAAQLEALITTVSAAIGAMEEALNPAPEQPEAA